MAILLVQGYCVCVTMSMCDHVHGLIAAQEPSTWVEVHGGDEFQHPYSYLLFLGVDGAGDLLPVKQLRDKYAVQRRDVYTPGGEDEDEDEDEEEPGPTP